jgi:hypothetical protein
MVRYNIIHHVGDARIIVFIISLHRHVSLLSFHRGVGWCRVRCILRQLPRGSSRDTLFVHPRQHDHVPAVSGVCTNGALVPRAVVLPRPLQRLKVPALCGCATRANVPRAALVVQPLQHVQMPARSSGLGRHRVPRAPDVMQPLHHIQVPARSGGGTRPRVPRAPGVLQPLQHLQVPGRSGERTRASVPRAPGVVQSLQHFQVPATSGERTRLCHTQPRGTVQEYGAPPRGQGLLVFGPPHQRGPRHRRCARAIRPRE